MVKVKTAYPNTLYPNKNYLGNTSLNEYGNVVI